ncbi:MAG: hypothetical protein PVI40_02060 [Chlamydiota bacterium]|jgi:hypothetical protein
MTTPTTTVSFPSQNEITEALSEPLKGPNHKKRHSLTLVIEAAAKEFANAVMAEGDIQANVKEVLTNCKDTHPQFAQSRKARAIMEGVITDALIEASKK